MELAEIITVLVVDDSAYMRKVVREMLSNNPFIEVVGTARNGIEALELVDSLRPAVVVSDLLMPELDGVEFVKEQMRRRPLPIVLMSSLSEGGTDVLAGLDAGAVDFVQKPTALAVEKVYEIRGELLGKIKAAAGIRPEKLPELTKAGAVTEVRTMPAVHTASGIDAVVIGISTGGPQALRFLIPQLPADFPIPIAIVMHMPIGYTAMYAEKLNEISALQVREAQEGDLMQAGTVLLAQGGKHLALRKRPGGEVVAHLALRPQNLPHRPSVDVLFESAATVFDGRTLGVVMTGMGSDGRAGAAHIKARGGTVFAESEESCVVYGMPGSVVEAGLADRIVSLDRMAQALLEVA